MSKKTKIENLSRQVYLPSINTSFFYNKEEQEIQEKLNSLYLFAELNKDVAKEKYIYNAKASKKEKAKTKKLKNKMIRKMNKNINEAVKEERVILSALIKVNKNVRELTGEIKVKHFVGMFESTLSRQLQMVEDEPSDDLVIVEIFHHDILKQLLTDGFKYKSYHYKYFSSSSGQIKNHKCVFIKEELWKQHQYTLMCGLDFDTINTKGGINPNKLLSYMMLSNSATTKWDISLDRIIVVPDMELDVHGLVDYVDDETFSVTREERDVPITHTDGVGMCLPSISDKAFMVRGPWTKGLVVPVPYLDFIEQCGNTKVVDVWNKEWDIIEDNIQVILSKSQLKLKDYYSNWEEYKQYFSDYGCELSIGNVEDEHFKDATLTYQMLQTLIRITDKELLGISQTTREKIERIGRDKDVMLDILGVTDTNEKKNYLQQAIEIYPELMSDAHVKKVVSDTKKSIVNDAKQGKIEIPNAKYTYVVPDVYAWMDWLFNKNINPKGLLDKNQVSCKLYEDKTRLDCLRSPHLFREHGLMDNRVNEETTDWFVSNCVYVSIHSLLPKMLQYDCDGDKLVLCPDEHLIAAAERDMKDVVPLVYNLRSADKKIINNDVFYESLIAGFGSRIGDISNSISRAWHMEDIDDSVLKDLKLLCAINNSEIDYSKTLFRLDLPEDIKQSLSKYQHGKLPHVFMYAKDKKEKRVKPMGNSTMDRLAKQIPNTRIHFTALFGKFDWKMLVKNPRVKIDPLLIEKYDELNKSKKWLIRDSGLKDRKEAKLYVWKHIKTELLAVNPKRKQQEVVDMLVKHLHMVKDAENKDTLWNVFGWRILNNLKQNIDGTKQCEDCLCRIKKAQGKRFCEECAEEREAKRKKEAKNNLKKAI